MAKFVLVLLVAVFIATGQSKSFTQPRAQQTTTELTETESSSSDQGPVTLAKSPTETLENMEKKIDEWMAILEIMREQTDRKWLKSLYSFTLKALKAVKWFLRKLTAAIESVYTAVRPDPDTDTTTPEDRLKGKNKQRKNKIMGREKKQKPSLVM